MSYLFQRTDGPVRSSESCKVRPSVKKTIYPRKIPKKFTTLNLVRHVAETDFPKICVAKLKIVNTKWRLVTETWPL